MYRAVDAGLASLDVRSLTEAAQRQEAAGQPAALLVAAPLRPVLARFVRQGIPGLHVLSFNEIPDDRQVRIVATVGA